MKVFKKLAGAALAVCLAVPVFGTVAFAADGVLMYSDPSTKVGENVSIDLVVQSDSGETVGDVEVTMSYDPEALEFVSGEGFTADGSGSLTYSGTGDGAELRAPVTFRALKSGEATLDVESSSATLADGETLELTEGSSTVTIDAADDGTTEVEPSGATAGAAAGATTDIVVSVNGTDYNFSEAFTGTDIPDGFSETTLTFNGGERKFVSNEAGVVLGYLVDASGAGSFFLFNEEDATFAPYIQLVISDTTSIVPLSQAEGISLPETYQQVELTVQDQQYPAWSDPMAPRYYVLNALNTRTGETHLYQYDTDDGTYQYFITSEQGEETTAGLPIPGKVGEVINEHLVLFFAAGVALALILFILMIVFAVKLIHRNQELDDLYDEYDIPFDDEDEAPEQEKKSSEESEDDDEYDDDEYDDEYDDDEYDGDEYEDDDEYDDDEYDDDDYDDDEYDDDYDEEAVSTTKISSRKDRKSDKADDDYNIDFVDI